MRSPMPAKDGLAVRTRSDTGHPKQPRARSRSWPVPDRFTLTSLALPPAAGIPPGGPGRLSEAGALAVGLDGATLIYEPSVGLAPGGHAGIRPPGEPLRCRIRRDRKCLRGRSGRSDPALERLRVVARPAVFLAYAFAAQRGGIRALGRRLGGREQRSDPALQRQRLEARNPSVGGECHVGCRRGLGSVRRRRRQSHHAHSRRPIRNRTAKMERKSADCPNLRRARRGSSRGFRTAAWSWPGARSCWFAKGLRQRPSNPQRSRSKASRSRSHPSATRTAGSEPSPPSPARLQPLGSRRGIHRGRRADARDGERVGRPEPW